MKLDIQAESIKAAPAIGGSFLSALTYSDMAAIATVLYVLLQGAYLLWKWRKEVSEG